MSRKNNNFIYSNPNPEAKYKKNGEPYTWRKGDCVIRAFSHATGLSWESVFDIACRLAMKHHDMPNSDTVLCHLAKHLGFERRVLPKYTTAGVFAETFKDDVCVCRLRSHVVCSKDGNLYDTWNCGGCRMKSYYILVDAERAHSFNHPRLPFTPLPNCPF